MKTVTTNLYTIDEHPNPELVYQWIRENWHDLAQHCVEEMATSLQAFADEYNLTLDYSISAVPDRGEFIRFTDPETGCKPEHFTMPETSGNCDLTGVCYDEIILNCETLEDIEYRVFQVIHGETEYIYSDEALYDRCESMAYYFHANGAIE